MEKRLIMIVKKGMNNNRKPVLCQQALDAHPKHNFIELFYPKRYSPERQLNAIKFSSSANRHRQ